MRRAARLVITAALLASCHGDATRMPAGERIDEPTLGRGTPEDFEGTLLTVSPIPGVRELARTLQARPEAVHRWLDGAGPDASSLDPAPSVVHAVERELEALRAWDRAGAEVPLGCLAPDLGLVFSLHGLVGALAHRDFVTEANVHALLHVGHAIAAPGNGLVAVAMGTAISLAVATALGPDHPLACRTMLRTFAPQPTRLVAAARAALACTVGLARTIGPASVPAAATTGELTPFDAAWTQTRLERERARLGLANPPDWLAQEWRSYARFWTDTEARAATATTLPVLAALYEERAATAAAHPTSMLVRLIGEMLFTRQAETLPRLAEQAALYEQLAAAAPVR